MKEENNPSNTMTATKRNYNIRIGRHFMKNVSPQQLKTIHQLIRNFREKEEGIPAALPRQIQNTLPLMPYSLQKTPLLTALPVISRRNTLFMSVMIPSPTFRTKN